jgi:chloramphenicol 3-O phosphotransferase
LPALVTAVNNIILDHTVETKAWLYELVSLISDPDVFIVAVHCSLPELEQCEIQRGSRHPSEAHQVYDTVAA